MKTLLKLILIQVLIVASVVGAAKDNLDAATDLTSTVSASGSKPLTPGPLLDDFRYAAPLNVWGALTGTFGSSAPDSGICTSSYTNNPAIAYGGSGYSLKLDYNVNNANSYAGYVSQLGSASLSGYTAVSFYVRGSAGGEFFKIQLKNTGTTSYWDAGKGTHYFRNTASMYVNDYLDSGVTTSWQKVTIPFHNFVNLDSFSSMKELVFVFENSQSVTNDSPRQGTVYIDNITFETSAVSVVRVDHFGDKIGVCALGGNIGTTASGGTISYSFSNVTNEYSPSPYGMNLNYDVSALGAWAATYLIFGGGYTDNTVEKPGEGGWINIPHDFSAYNRLYIRVRAKSATENPKEMKIELVDDTGTRFERIGGITDFWQYWSLDFSNRFTGLNKSSIKQLTFVFEGYRIDAAGGNRVGTVFVDFVQFE